MRRAHKNYANDRLSHEGIFTFTRQPSNNESLSEAFIGVAIHGIGGDAYRTWMASNGALWLRDFLSKDIENVRVFSFGYDARVWPTKAKGTVESFARSLLNDLRMMQIEGGKVRRFLMPYIILCLNTAFIRYVVHSHYWLSSSPLTAPIVIKLSCRRNDR